MIVLVASSGGWSAAGAAKWNDDPYPSGEYVYNNFLDFNTEYRYELHEGMDIGPGLGLVYVPAPPDASLNGHLAFNVGGGIGGVMLFTQATPATGLGAIRFEHLSSVYIANLTALSTDALFGTAGDHLHISVFSRLRIINNEWNMVAEDMIDPRDEFGTVSWGGDSLEPRCEVYRITSSAPEAPRIALRVHDKSVLGMTGCTSISEINVMALNTGQSTSIAMPHGRPAVLSAANYYDISYTTNDSFYYPIPLNVSLMTNGQGEKFTIDITDRGSNTASFLIALENKNGVIVKADPTPSSVTNWGWSAGALWWTVDEPRDDLMGFELRMSKHWDDGPWVTIAAIDRNDGSDYRVELNDATEASTFRIFGIYSGRKSELLRTIKLDREREAASLKCESVDVQVTRTRLERLVAEMPRTGTKSNSRPGCVIFTRGEFVQDLERILVPFWSRLRGIEPVVIDIDVWGANDQFVRESIAATIQTYGADGCDLFHLVGDACEYQEYAQVDTTQFPLGVGYLEEARNVVPTYYLWDNETIAYGRPYYATDFPYSDLDGDGLPDVVVTRWDVASVEELLPRLAKLIEYNKNERGTPDTAGMRVLAVAANEDSQGNSGQRAADAGEAAISAIPDSAEVEIIFRHTTDFATADVEACRDLWNQYEPEAVFLWSPHSSRRSPNGLLWWGEPLTGPSGMGLQEGHPALVVANGCLVADFARAEYWADGAQRSWLAADTYATAIDRGSIGWVGPTSVSYQRVHALFSRTFAAALFSNAERTMAEAWKEAVRTALELAVGDAEMVQMLRTYVFLGDPLTRLQKRTNVEGSFENITQGALVGADRDCNTAEFVDYDNDGELELYLGNGPISSNDGARNQLIELGHMAPVIDITPDVGGVGIDWIGDTVESAWADYDNDGDPDVYLVNGNEIAAGNNNVLLKNCTTMNGSPVFSRVTNGDVAALEDPAAEGSAEWVDLDGDGQLDLFIGRLSGSPLVFRGTVGTDGEIELRQEMVPGLTDIVLAGETAWCDYNQDGSIDLFAYGVGGVGMLLENNGGMEFVDVAQSRGVAGAGTAVGRAAAWADYDNDGDFDLYVSRTDGASWLLRNDGGMFSDVAVSVGLSGIPTPAVAVSWTDIDSDGDADLVIGLQQDWNENGPAILVYENMFPVSRFELLERHGLESIHRWHDLRALSFGDIDRDGDEDFYVSTNSLLTGAGSFLCWNRLGDTANSLRIKLRGVIATSDAIGAIVTVRTEDGVEQLRQLTGASGGRAHPVRELSVGLGRNAEALRVEVAWPWGRVTEVGHVSAGTVLELTDAEPAREVGEIYLTTRADGARDLTIASRVVGEVFDCYLGFAPVSGTPMPYGMSGFEVSVSVPDHFSVLEEDVLLPGVDNDVLPLSYKYENDNCIEVIAEPVVLVHYVVRVASEGADGEFALRNVLAPTFKDPLVPSVPSWTECGSGVLYRLPDPGLQDPFVVPIDDSKNPALAHTGLWMSNRNTVIVSYDEPVADSVPGGGSLTDLANYTVYNGDVPTVTKTVTAVFRASDRDFLVVLDSDIQDGKYFRIAVTGATDLHANTATSLDGQVTSAGEDGGDIELNETMPGGGKSVGYDWFELTNSGDQSVCLNGWSIVDNGGVAYSFPESPITISLPGQYAVLVATPQGLVVDGEQVGVVAEIGEGDGAPNEIVVYDPFSRIADSVTVDAAGFKSRQGCSIQRVRDTRGATAEWVAEGPEFAPGLRGTPGTENLFADGTVAEIEVPELGSTRVLFIAPNPFNPETTIALVNAHDQDVSVRVYDVRGRLVRVLHEGLAKATARMEIVWDGRGQDGARTASGVYFVRIRAADGANEVEKVLLMK